MRANIPTNSNYQNLQFKLNLPQYWHSSDVQMRTLGELSPKYHQKSLYEDSLYSPKEKIQCMKVDPQVRCHTFEQNDSYQQQMNENEKIPNYTSIGHLKKRYEQQPAFQDYNSPEFVRMQSKQLKKFHPYDQPLKKDGVSVANDQLQMIKGLRKDSQHSDQSITIRQIQINDLRESKNVINNGARTSIFEVNSITDDEIDYMSYQSMLKDQRVQNQNQDTQLFRSFQNRFATSKDESLDQRQDSNFFSNPIDMNHFLNYINQESLIDKHQKPSNSIRRLDHINMSFKQKTCDNSTQTINNHNDLTLINTQEQYSSTMQTIIEPEQKKPLMERSTSKKPTQAKLNPSLTSTKNGSQSDNLIKKSQNTRSYLNTPINIQDQRESERSFSYTLNFENITKESPNQKGSNNKEDQIQRRKVVKNQRIQNNESPSPQWRSTNQRKYTDQSRQNERLYPKYKVQNFESPINPKQSPNQDRQKFMSPKYQRISPQSRSNSSEQKRICQRFLHHHNIDNQSQYDSKIIEKDNTKPSINIKQLESPNTAQISKDYIQRDKQQNSLPCFKKQTSPVRGKSPSYLKLHGTKYSQSNSLLSNFLQNLNK